jgi:branched-chain amino acid transport system ATP-binding protein
MEPQLKIDNLTVKYSQVAAVEEVSMCVNQGELVSIIGSNGAGKSSLLKSICGLVLPAAGSISFNGTRIESLPPYEIVKLGIAYCPEGRRVFPELTVFENLRIGAYIRKEVDWKSDLVNIFQLFPRLKERKKQLASSLSGGEQQMLAIGRALMSSPKLILFDEPSLGLAPVIVEEVAAIIEDIRRRGVTVVLVEQNANMAMKLGDRCYVLEMGKVVLSGSREELLKKEEVRTAYLGI